MNRFVQILIILNCNLFLFGQGPPCLTGLSTTYSIALSGDGYGVASADFNGDGLKDLAISASGFPNPDNVSVFINKGNNSFFAAAIYTLVGIYPAWITSADFNNDGKPDLATACNSTGEVSVLINTGTGTFLPAVNYWTSSWPSNIISNDFNNDGNVDIVTSNSASSDISVFFGSGTGTFSPCINYSVSLDPRCLTSADFNNDGFLDIATSNFNSNNVTQLMNDGFGSFSVSSIYTVGLRPESITAGDFNNDGSADLAVTNYSSASVSVLLNNGAGIMTSNLSYPVEINPYAITSGDFDSDGKIDLAITQYYSREIAILRNTGAGIFAAAKYYASDYNPHCIISTDLNNDTKQDLVVANISNDASVLINAGNAQFMAPLNFSITGNPFAPAMSIIAKDFNADGITDLAIATGTAGNEVRVLTGVGNASFAVTGTYSINGTDVKELTSGDFNSDGKPDIAAVNYSSNNISLLLSTATNSFLPVINYPVGNNPNSIHSADFNNDGKLDLAVANWNSNNIHVKLGNGAGGFTSTVILSLIQPWYLNSADMNGDGNIDLVVTDLAYGNLVVFLGNGSGGFGSPITTNIFIGARMYTAIADLNGDFILDVAVANYYSNSVKILLGIGNGSFTVVGNYVTGAGPYNIKATDLNSDSNIDLVIANVNEDNISVLMNSGGGVFTSGGKYYNGCVPSSIGSGPMSIAIADFNVDGLDDIATAGGINASVILRLPSPVISASGNSSLICSGVSVTLTATGANTYSWTGLSNSPSVVVSPTTTTIYMVTGTNVIGCAGVSTIAQNVSPCTDINEINELISEINIYPNPNNGSFKLQIDNEIPNGELILFNSIGQRVYEQKINQGENNIITNALAKGLYHYIVLQNKRQLNNGKLVIE